jgi:hypothetical protein
MTAPKGAFEGLRSRLIELRDELLRALAEAERVEPALVSLLASIVTVLRALGGDELA